MSCLDSIVYVRLKLSALDARFVISRPVIDAQTKMVENLKTYNEFEEQCIVKYIKLAKTWLRTSS